MHSIGLRNAARVRRAAVWLALSCATWVQAASIEYSLASLGGNRWQYDYTLVNPDATTVFDEITIYFALPAVSQVVSFAAPSGWGPLVVQPDPALPADGFVDAVNAAGPVTPGSRTGSFSAVFDFAAGMTPAGQNFELALSNGPGGFAVVAAGVTSPVPEPGALMLMLSGASVLAWAVRPRRGARGRAEGASTSASAQREGAIA